MTDNYDDLPLLIDEEPEVGVLTEEEARLIEEAMTCHS